VSKGYYRYLGVRQNKSLIITSYYSFINTKSNKAQWSILLKKKVRLKG